MRLFKTDQSDSFIEDMSLFKPVRTLHPDSYWYLLINCTQYYTKYIHSLLFSTMRVGICNNGNNIAVELFQTFTVIKVQLKHV